MLRWLRNLRSDVKGIEQSFRAERQVIRGEQERLSRPLYVRASSGLVWLKPQIVRRAVWKERKPPPAASPASLRSGRSRSFAVGA